MAGELSAPPILSTPADHLFENSKPDAQDQSRKTDQYGPRTDDELLEIYEVPRTASEILAGGWRRIALQFPDSMLAHAPRVVEILRRELERQALPEVNPDGATEPPLEGAAGATQTQDRSQSPETSRAVAHKDSMVQQSQQLKQQVERRIYIMADTSYSACCVDEIAAEHVAADVVVHYGRSCLSHTSRLPVVYVFTRHRLAHDDVVAAFEAEFPDKEAKVVMMADVTYQDHVATLARRLRAAGYARLWATTIVHDPMGRIPNRKMLDVQGNEIAMDGPDGRGLAEYSIFHISSPPTALLLALASRVASLHIFPTKSKFPSSSSSSSSSTTASAQSARRLLGRRYARVLTLATAGIIGILVNTLSVANYQSAIDNIRKQIAAAGKKSYTVVVGKLNPAKLANFAEIDGWVVVGCWESSLVEDDAGFFRPVITPFELNAALAGDENRVWGDEWWGSIESVKPTEVEREGTAPSKTGDNPTSQDEEASRPSFVEGDVDEEESEPPEFDLRTGRLVSRSRPMRAMAEDLTGHSATDTARALSSALSIRPKGDLAMVNGVLSPGAEYLRSQRTWQGLGTDFDATQSSSPMEEGRSGVARGYTVGPDSEKR